MVARRALPPRASSHVASPKKPTRVRPPRSAHMDEYLLALPAYRLALPFTQEAWRQLAYTHALTGTSF